MLVLTYNDLIWTNAKKADEQFPTTAGKRSRHTSRHVHDARAVMHAGVAN